MKICSFCNSEKEDNCFYKKKYKSGNFGISSECKECIKYKRKQYISNNKEKLKVKSKEYRDNNKEKLKVKSKEYRDNNKENISNKDRIYYISNKDVILKKNSEYRKNHKNKAYENTKKWRSENLEYSRLYYRNYNKEYNKLPERKLINSQRKRINRFINNKSISSKHYIGCSVQEFKKWIEYQFTSMMEWGNYGTYWNFDHVIPCSEFSTIKGNYHIFKWENIRPLEKTKNFSKNNKILIHDILFQELKVKYYKQHLQIAGKPLSFDYGGCVVTHIAAPG